MSATHSGAVGPTGPTISADSQTQTTHSFAQTTELPAVHEPRTLLACREVTAWAVRVRKMKAPIISEENWAGVSLGICVGLAVYLIGGDFTKHPTTHGFVQAGVVFSGVMTIAFASLAGARRRREQGGGKQLAGEMEVARDANSVPEAKP
jgi:hypothetical protein